MRTASLSVPRSTIPCPSAPSVASTVSRRWTPRWSNATATFTSGHALAEGERARDDVVDRVAELLEHGRARRRRAEVPDRDRVAVVADPALPAEPDSRLDRDARLHVGRQDLVAIVGPLRLVELPARHRDHAAVHALLVQLLRCAEGDVHLG